MFFFITSRDHHLYRSISLCKLIWRHWIYKMPVSYLSCVWVRLSIFSSYPLYNIWGCVFAVYPFPLWWLRGYILCLIIVIKSEVWTITHCLGYGHETIVCVVCLSIFLWIIMMTLWFGNTFNITGSVWGITSVTNRFLAQRTRYVELWTILRNRRVVGDLKRHDARARSVWCREINKNMINSVHSAVSAVLQWRHNGRDGVWNHQPHDCLLNRLIRRRS